VSPPRRVFGTTWWGKAWVDALEGRARLDPNRLPRGRTYARQDRAGALTIAPGSVTAKVSGSRRTPYAVEVRVRTFTDDEADRVVAAIAAKAAHAAALLDGELEPGVLDDVTGAGVDLLPGPGELGPRCSCPDWADPCKHAAAVCYLVADTIDADPFELFHLRGLPRERLLASVRERRRADAGAGAGASDDGAIAARSSTRRARTRRAAADGSDRPGSSTEADGTPDRSDRSDRSDHDVVAARDVFAAPQPDAAALWALPLPAPPHRPGRPPPAAVDPPRSSPLAPADLQALAADAAQRAWALVRGDADSRLGLPAEHDLARRAAPLIGTSAFGDLAARSGVAPRLLVTLALAWRLGGADAVTIATESWVPPPGALDDGRAALAAAFVARPGLATDGRLDLDGDHRGYDEDGSDDEDDWEDWDDDDDDWVDEDDEDDEPPPPPRIVARTNRLSAAAVQLRLSRSGSWYRFVKVADEWELAAGPALDPSDLFERRR